MNLKSITSFITNPVMLKFVLVGLAGAISVQALTIFFTSVMNIFYGISVAISFELTLIWMFFIHDSWTFAAVNKKSKTLMRFYKYNIFSLMTLGINEIVLLFFTIEIHWNYVYSEFLAIIVGFFFNYTVNRKISWKAN